MVLETGRVGVDGDELGVFGFVGMGSNRQLDADEFCSRVSEEGHWTSHVQKLL